MVKLSRLPIVQRANWRPLDDQKKTMCGRLDRFEFFLGGGTEFDWNIFVVPEDKRFIEQAKKLQKALPRLFGEDFKIHRCGEEECMEVEVMPPASFRENAFFYGGYETALTGGTLLTRSARGWRSTGTTIGRRSTPPRRSGGSAAPAARAVARTAPMCS